MDRKLAQTCRELEQLLRQQLQQHEALLNLCTKKRTALRNADEAAMHELCQRENGVVQKVSEMEKQRLALAADLTLIINPAAPEPMRLAELADRLEEPMRTKLLVLRQQLREAMEKTQQEAQVVRRATEAMARHMHGVVQSMGCAVTGVGVYTQRGSATQRATAVSTFSATG